MADDLTKVLLSDLINDEDNDSTGLRGGGKIYPPCYICFDLRWLLTSNAIRVIVILVFSTSTQNR